MKMVTQDLVAIAYRVQTYFEEAIQARVKYH